MSDAAELSRILSRIDGRGYKAYGEIRGRFTLAACTLFVDHVQGDPFAAPSKLRLRVAMDAAALPPELRDTKVRRIALADYLARRVRDAIEATRGGASGGERGEERGEERDGERGRGAGGRRGAAPGGGSGKSGRVQIDAGGQEVLERTAVVITDEWVEARIEVGLPAAGRRVLGRVAEALLLGRLPEIADRSLLWPRLDGAEGRRFVACVENQESIRARLAELGLVAFVADGSILPRESGASERPMRRGHARPFVSPESMRVELEVPHPVDGPNGPDRRIRGMGIRRGITLIVGGGYHGKSTLLRALECCVYPHVPGDGREYVVADAGLVKIRAEDGRAVTGVDIHAFIDTLPSAPDEDPARAAGRTRFFSTADASGSTSQAASIVEAIEAGASGLLLDEDTSATNFMLRDARMQRLVQRDHEPITPFVDRVRELHDVLGISTVLVMGGCGDYFDVADQVVMMRDYEPLDVTDEARRIAREHASGRAREVREAMSAITPRVPVADSIVASRGRRETKITTKSRELVIYGEQALDLRHLTQLLDTSQTRAVAHAIHLASERFMARRQHDAREPAADLPEVLDRIEALLDEQGLDVLDPFARSRGDGRHPGALARPRRHEIAAALDRMRGLEVRPPHG